MRATLQDHARLAQHGYSTGRWGQHGWTCQDADGAYLLIGSHGCCAPTQWEAVAEGLLRIWDNERWSTVPAMAGVAD